MGATTRGAARAPFSAPVGLPFVCRPYEGRTRAVVSAASMPGCVNAVRTFVATIRGRRPAGSSLTPTALGKLTDYRVTGRTSRMPYGAPGTIRHCADVPIHAAQTRLNFDMPSEADVRLGSESYEQQRTFKGFLTGCGTKLIYFDAAFGRATAARMLAWPWVVRQPQYRRWAWSWQYSRLDYARAYAQMITRLRWLES